MSDTDLKRVRKKYNLAKPVVLAVGDIESRKNLSRLIEAFALIRQKADLQLVLVGRPKRGLEVLQHLIESHQLTDHVVQTGYVVDEDMPVLYHLSKVFVYPSLYEGFGIPPLEAMMCGTPVVASKASSIPEVIGDAGVLVDPESVEDIADSIERVLWDPVFAQTLVEKGYQRAQQFSWEITAKETLQIFETAKK